MLLRCSDQSFLQIFARMTGRAAQSHLRPQIIAARFREDFFARAGDRFDNIRRQSDFEFAIDVAVLERELSFETAQTADFPFETIEGDDVNSRLSAHLR